MGALKKLLLISIPTLLLVLAFLEFVVLRFWVPVDDVPIEQYDTANGIIHYRPGQVGRTYPDRDLHHPVPFSVNADGWNSLHPRYEAARDGKLRVAVVGDSYVAAFEVAPRSSMAARLEALLGPENAEVYPFGVRGAPLSEYLQIARYVVARYEPDVVVLVIVHNDFDESYRVPPGRYTSSFLHVRFDGDRVEEVPPGPYREPRLEQWVRTRSFAFRFLFYRLQIGSQQLRSLYASMLGNPRRFEANVDTAQLAGDGTRMREAANYVFGQLARLQDSSKARFLMVMDAPRAAIYVGRDPRTTAAYEMNRIAADASSAAGLSFVDLTPFFEREYLEHGARFDFPHDGHWNARAHGLVAKVVSHALEEQASGLRIRSGGSPA